MVKNIIRLTVGYAHKVKARFQKFGTFGMKKTAIVGIIFFAVLLGWIVLLEYFMADKYQVMVRIGNKAAAEAANADIIDYGTLAQGESVARFITIENRGERDMHVKILMVGEVFDILKISKNEFTLSPQQKTTIQLFAEIPQDPDREWYKGRIIVFKIPDIL